MEPDMTFRTPLLMAALLSSLAAQAQSNEEPRRDILAQGPALAEDLPEALASLQQALGDDAEVQVLLQLDAGGLRQIESVQGSRRYLSRVRSALNGLDCRTATPQRQLLTIRFQDPQTPRAPMNRLAAGSAPQ
jgi:hypothetical protein